jgi:ABC-type antimicrobial peptide transport system permease subunit
MRQAIIVAVGLALGIGLVIVVTAVSSGVKNAQASVLHALYGQGTDITVTKTPTQGTGTPGSFGFRGQTGTQTRPAAGFGGPGGGSGSGGGGGFSGSFTPTSFTVAGVDIAHGELGPLSSGKLTGWQLLIPGGPRSAAGLPAHPAPGPHRPVLGR